MKLAVNYSQPALSLWRESRLPVDVFKCPDWSGLLEEFCAAGPVYIHFRLMAGVGALADFDYLGATALKERTRTPYVNLHIAPYLHLLQKTQAWQDDPRDATLFSMLKEDILKVAARFGAENVLIENAPYRDAKGEMALAGVDPATLSRLVRETGCRFLLDLAHARIAANQLGVPEREYIDGLPLHRLGEMHITGLQWENGILVDHYPLQEEDWQAAEWAMQNIHAGRWAKPWAVTFEYGGIGPGYAERTDAHVLLTQVPRLRKLIDRTDRLDGSVSFR